MISKWICLFFMLIVIPVFSQEPSVIRRLYDESDEIFPNPERGFYEYTQLASLYSLSIRQDNQTLIFGRIVADPYRAKDFDQNFLNRIQHGFDVARNAGVKVNVRVAYNDEIGQPDASKEQIFRHIDQLQPLLEKNKDVINLMEAGFIGAWGEWHGSTHGLDTPDNRRDILFKILSALPTQRMVCLRTPHFKRQIFYDSLLVEEMAFDGSFLARTGFHNDCFLSSANDVGTYIVKSRAEEIAYIGNETRYTPFGGESCDLCDYSLCDNAIREMELLHCSYLNDGWYPGVLDRWEANNCMDEIQRRLGYRFVMRAVEISEKVKPGGVLVCNLEIENVGFAAPYNPRLVELVAQNNQTLEFATARISVDPRYWLPGEIYKIKRKFQIPVDWNDGVYTVMLRLPDPEPTLSDDPRYSIRLANMDTWDENTGGNLITSALLIDSTTTGAYHPAAYEFKEISTIDGIEKAAGKNLPTAYQLMAYPNPFNGEAKITFSLPQSDNVKLQIFNIQGRLVNTLVNKHLSPGEHRIKWNGDSIDNEAVSSGIYLVRLQTSHFSNEIKITYIK